MTPILYQDAAADLNISEDALRHGITRGVLTRLPRQGKYRHLIKEQVMLFKGKRLSYSALSVNEKIEWEYWNGVADDPGAQHISIEDLDTIVDQRVNQRLDERLTPIMEALIPVVTQWQQAKGQKRPFTVAPGDENSHIESGSTGADIAEHSLDAIAYTTHLAMGDAVRLTPDDLARITKTLHEFFDARELVGLDLPESPDELTPEATFTDEQAAQRGLYQLIWQYIPHEKLQKLLENQERKEAEQAPERPKKARSVA